MQARAPKILDITAESIEAELKIAVPDLYVTIAKHIVFGWDNESIAEVFGVTPEDVTDLRENHEDFKQIHKYVAMTMAARRADIEGGWEALEKKALENLQNVMEANRNDPDLNLKIAVAANKAERRQVNQNSALNPANNGTRIAITVSQRMIQKLKAPVRISGESANGETVVEETREAEFSIEQTMSRRPSFKDVDALLGVSKQNGTEIGIDLPELDELVDPATKVGS